MKALDIQNLIKSGLFGYGTEMTANSFGALDNIYPADFTGMTRDQEISAIRKYDLQLLGLYGQVNDQLLGMGRKLVRQADDYIIPTVSETTKYIDQYYKQGDTKIRKGKKLYTSFTALHETHTVPPEVKQQHRRTLAGQDQSSSLSGPAC